MHVKKIILTIALVATIFVFVSAPVASQTKSDKSMDVYIDGQKRFVIQWDSQDFNTVDEENEIIGYVENVAKTSWITLVSWFDLPPDPDGVIEIKLEDRAFPQYMKNPDGNQWLSITHAPERTLITYLSVMKNYYPAKKDAYSAAITHEFFHSIQESYLSVSPILENTIWIVEGTASFIQSFVDPDAEFWENTYIEGLSGGPYNQTPEHSSSYIKNASTYFISPTGLVNKEYYAAIYWRYLYENHGGISTIKNIIERIKADNSGSDISKQIDAINAVLGTTDIYFSDFVTANYLDFSSQPFARNDTVYQYSDRYCEVVPISLKTTFNEQNVGYSGEIDAIWAADARCAVSIPATIDIDPDTLNLKSNGKWITACIELPQGYDVENINISSVELNDAVPAEADLKYGFVKDPEIKDRDGDGLPELMVKFDRAAVQALVRPGDNVVLTVTGNWHAVMFKGSDGIRVINPGGSK